MAARCRCATRAVIGSNDTLDSVRAWDAQNGGMAVPLQIAGWHRDPARSLFDENSGAGES